MNFKQVTTLQKVWQAIIKVFYEKHYSETLLVGPKKIVEIDESSFRRKY